MINASWHVPADSNEESRLVERSTGIVLGVARDLHRRTDAWKTLVFLHSAIPNDRRHEVDSHGFRWCYLQDMLAAERWIIGAHEKTRQLRAEREWIKP